MADAVLMGVSLSPALVRLDLLDRSANVGRNFFCYMLKRNLDLFFVLRFETKRSPSYVSSRCCADSSCNGTFQAGSTEKTVTIFGSVVTVDDPDSCIWHIIAPPAQRVKLLVDPSSTLFRHYCNESGLQYKGNGKCAYLRAATQ